MLYVVGMNNSIASVRKGESTKAVASVSISHSFFSPSTDLLFENFD